MEAIVSLLTVEASIVAPKLSVIMHAVVEAPSVFLVRASVHTSVVALVLLHCQLLLVFFSWNVLASDLVIVSAKLIIAIFIEVVPMRIEEVTTLQNIEAIVIILTSSSVLYLLTSEFPGLGSSFSLRIDWMSFLRQHLEFLLVDSRLIHHV